MRDLIIISGVFSVDDIITCFEGGVKCIGEDRRTIKLDKFFVAVDYVDDMIECYEDAMLEKIRSIVPNPRFFLLRYADLELVKAGLVVLNSKGFCLLDDDFEFLGTVDEFLQAF